MELTKIEDILSRLDNMVVGWKSMGNIPAVERDLALEELRRLYEQLLQCSGDSRVAESVGEVLAPSSAIVESVPEDIDDILDIDALLGLSDEERYEEPVSDVESVAESEVIAELEPKVTDIPFVEEQSIEQMSAPVTIQSFGGGLFDIDDIPVRTKSSRKMISLYNSPVEQQSDRKQEQHIEHKLKPMPEPVVVAEPPSVPAPAVVAESVESAASQVRLGDVLGGNTKTLGDTIMNDDVPTAPYNRIDDLRQAIGLNDKFLMIRDLFDGDAGKYEDTIETLNEFEDLDECMIYIVENFSWNPDCEGARLLVSLIERKLA